jgi:type IV secretory pathway VirD2 relaxase
MWPGIFGTNLEWVAVEHDDTEHPHVHVVVRGLRDDGEVLRMSRQYLQQGIRDIAEHLCTRQLGYRTQLDAAEAQKREISEKRFTSLDRQLIKDALNRIHLQWIQHAGQSGDGDNSTRRK